MKELLSNQLVEESSRPRRFKVELHGGTATMFNELSNGQQEAVYLFDGTESAAERRFDQEIVSGEKWWFEYTGGAKAFCS